MNGVDANGFQVATETISALKAFCSLTESDGESLAALRETVEEIAPDVIDGFYEHLNAHTESSRFLRDPELVVRLKNLQFVHLLEFFSGQYDVGYIQKRLHVGRIHEQIGLEPHTTIGAYNILIQQFARHLPKALGESIPDWFISVAKILLLDVALTVQAYHSASIQRLQRRNAELEQALRMYHETELKAENYARLAGHEIRSSLHAIANACDEVAEDYGDDVPQEVSETMAIASQRCWNLVQVVEQILSAPETSGRPQWVQANDVVQEVRNRVPLHLEGKSVRLESFDTPVRVWANPIGLREVFSNLVANAIHHLHKPEGRVVIEHNDSGDNHLFCVADDGPGIPLELQQQIFQPFIRGTATSEKSGKGLGLYFVRQIIDQHRGQVWVDSAPGGGSRFSFSLPKEPLLKADLNNAGGDG